VLPADGEANTGGRTADPPARHFGPRTAACAARAWRSPRNASRAYAPQDCIVCALEWRRSGSRALLVTRAVFFIPSSNPKEKDTAPMLDFGQASDESYAAGQTVAQCSQMVRKGFIRKVYGILSVQLLATAMMCALAMKATASEKVRSGMGVSVSVCLYASVMEVIDILFHIHCASRVHALATHLPRQMHQVGGYSVLSFGSLLASSSGLRIFIFVSPAHPRGCKRLREPPLPSPPPPVKWQAPLQGSSLLTEFVQACANRGAWCTRSFLSCVCWRCSA
jgi:hypothetical protein